MAKTKTKKGRRSTIPKTDKNKTQDIRLDSFFSSLGRIEIVLLIGGILLLLVLIYTIHSILSPFLAFGALLFILYPLRRYSLARNIIWLAVILFSLWFLYSISNILVTFIISLVFAYMLDPLVTYCQRWKIPRWISSLILILIFIICITLIIFLVIPIALKQLEGIVNSFADFTKEFYNSVWNSKLIKTIESYGVSVEELRKIMGDQLTPRFEDILKATIETLASLMGELKKFITQIFYIILIPFLTFYFLTDFPKINYRFKMLFPRHMRDRVEYYMSRADELIGNYLRGAITVAVIEGVIITLLFSLAGIKYAFLLGMLACIFDLIPYIGLIAILVISAIIALFSNPPALIKVAIAVSSISLLHMVEITFLSPKILGSKVGLHPLLIILAMLVFMYFLGIIGLFIAVPVTALIILFVQDWEARRRGIVIPPNKFDEELF